MQSKIQLAMESAPSNHLHSPPAIPDSRPMILYPLPPDVRAQCARDNKIRMERHKVSVPLGSNRDN